ncbi:MAG TPA: di-heme oxidoredictase family protein [Candidatus Acidoferrum sp.]|nr:di-heme oxidoredictase family protein [Candidatus Acidoferrum sp.]
MWFKKSTVYVCLLTGSAMALAMAGKSSGQNSSTATEAPSGYDNQPNGLTDSASFAADRVQFEQTEFIGDGLGPIFNAQSCRECHQNPVTGSTSQVKELRAGHHDAHGNFVGATATLADGTVTIVNRSLINQRAVCPAVDTITVNGQPQSFSFPQTQGQEHISTAETIRAFRMSLNTLGDGFIESIADQTLLDLASSQCSRTRGAICGEAVHVPVLESTGGLAVGRFGWKDQHASLLSFSSDAYLNEMGVSNRLPPNNVDVTRICDVIPDPNNATPDSEGLEDIDRFARFIRATKAPPRDTALGASSDSVTGASLFHNVGCEHCHVSSITTAPTGTAVAAGAFTVPDSLGNKIIHPYSDFLLHDVGTGDGIVQTGGQETARKLRTPPLWGVRTRTELLHDGRSATFFDAIQHHRGEASEVIEYFNRLNPAQQNQLITFLRSL